MLHVPGGVQDSGPVHGGDRGHHLDHSGADGQGGERGGEGGGGADLERDGRQPHPHGPGLLRTRDPALRHRDRGEQFRSRSPFIHNFILPQLRISAFLARILKDSFKILARFCKKLFFLEILENILQVSCLGWIPCKIRANNAIFAKTLQES